jgi:polyhydroxybutyrate depolymerase
MNRIASIFFVFFFLSCNDSNDTPTEQKEDSGPRYEMPESLEYYDSMDHDGNLRTFYVHLPEGYEPNQAYPMILAMHGGGRLGYEGIEGQSGLSDLSNEKDFIVVYPEGIKTLGFRTWNAGDCCPSATLLQTDDVGFILALVEELKSDLHINTKRIYAAGFSNGAQLAYKLANQHPNSFAAISAVAGVLQDFPFKPERKVPIIHFHSYQDSTAPYFGGLSDAPNIRNIFPSVDSTLSHIASNYSCQNIKEIIFSDSSTHDFFRYSDCLGDALIEQYVTWDGGHTWPGGQAFPGMPISKHINASRLMWDFFERYEIKE